MRLRAVFFDLGETLLHFGPVNLFEAFREGAQVAHRYLVDAGAPVPDWETFHRLQRRAIVRAYRWSLIRRRDFNAMDVLRKANAKMGLTTHPDDLRRLADLFYEPLRRRGRPEPNVKEILTWLRDRSYRLAIISNTIVPGVTLDAHLDREGLLDFFPHRIYSCDTGYRKPHPKIFAEALRQVGVAASESLFVGDTIPVDIKGANRVGMISILKQSGEQPATGRTRARHVISALSELQEIVLGYEGMSGFG